MNKLHQCKCPFQLNSDIYQCRISPYNPSVINHLQWRSHSHLGISEHTEGKVAVFVIPLMSLFIHVFTVLCVGERGASVTANKSKRWSGTNTQSRPPTPSCPHHFHSLPYTCLPVDKRTSPLTARTTTDHSSSCWSSLRWCSSGDGKSWWRVLMVVPSLS